MILTCKRTKVFEDKYLIPDVLWMEVLAYLPTKTLLRIRCVCKTWCSLIDSHYFTYKHLEIYNDNKRNNSLFIYGRLIRSPRLDGLSIRNLRSSFIIYQNDNSEKKLVSYLPDQGRFNRYYPETDIVNGLMLIRRQRYWSQDEQLCLWNPSIHKLIVLPTCPLTNTYLKLDFNFCLGFVPSCYDYKVIVFKENKQGETSEVEMAIYSLVENRWKVKPKWVNVLGRSLNLKKNYHLDVYTHENVVYSQGVVYWKPILFARNDNLVYFDFENETFGITELPAIIQNDDLKIVFVLNKSLAVLSVPYSEICIWVLEKDYAKKVKQRWCKYLVRDASVEPFEEAYAEARGIFTAFISLHHNIVYDEKNHTFFACFDDKISSFNIITHEFQNLLKSHKISYMTTYVESLMLHNLDENVEFFGQ